MFEYWTFMKDETEYNINELEKNCLKLIISHVYQDYKEKYYAGVI